MSKASQMEAGAAERLRYQDLLESMAAGGKLPFEDAARAVMITALQRETVDFAHAARAVGAAINAGAPKDGWTISELRKFVGATRPNTERRNLDCEKCYGSGWETVEGPTPDYEAACHCSAGCRPGGVAYHATTAPVARQEPPRAIVAPLSVADWVKTQPPEAGESFAEWNRKQDEGMKLDQRRS